MERKAAKELLHIQAWLTRVDEIVRRGEEAYLADSIGHGVYDAAREVGLETPGGGLGHLVRRPSGLPTAQPAADHIPLAARRHRPVRGRARQARGGDGVRGVRVMHVATRMVRGSVGPVR